MGGGAMGTAGRTALGQTRPDGARGLGRWFRQGAGPQSSYCSIVTERSARRFRSRNASGHSEGDWLRPHRELVERIRTHKPDVSPKGSFDITGVAVRA